MKNNYRDRWYMTIRYISRTIGKFFATYARPLYWWWFTVLGYGIEIRDDFFWSALNNKLPHNDGGFNEPWSTVAVLQSICGYDGYRVETLAAMIGLRERPKSLQMADWDDDFVTPIENRLSKPSP
jgi:hypothetical protein